MVGLQEMGQAIELSQKGHFKTAQGWLSNHAKAFGVGHDGPLMAYNL